MKRKLILTTIATIALSLSPNLASANHSWAKYHWDRSSADTITNPLQIGDNLTTDAWKTSLDLASTDWNKSIIYNQVTNGLSSDSNCNPNLERIEVCNGEYGDNGWLGIAQVWAYRGKDSHIAQAVVKLNDTYYNLASYNTDPWRNLVMCQEVGHTLGLGHQDEAFDNENLGTCMDYTSDPDGLIKNQANNEHPNEHDYAMLEKIYSHLNSTGGSGGGKPDTGNGGGRGGKPTVIPAANLNGLENWGNSLASDGQGRPNLFTRNLGESVVVYTHVFWTLDAEGQLH